MALIKVKTIIVIAMGPASIGRRSIYIKCLLFFVVVRSAQLDLSPVNINHAGLYRFVLIY